MALWGPELTERAPCLPCMAFGNTFGWRPRCRRQFGPPAGTVGRLRRPLPSARSSLDAPGLQYPCNCWRDTSSEFDAVHMRRGTRIDHLDLKAKVAEVLDRWPSAGVAVGVVRDGSLEWFLGHGVADVGSHEQVTEGTVFRIGSLTKTITGTAVMQLWERGLVDLDAPANDYLRTFRLVPARDSLRLRPAADGQSRLVARMRGRSHPKALLRPFLVLFGDPLHFAMQVRQFQNLRTRVSAPVPKTTGRGNGYCSDRT